MTDRTTGAGEPSRTLALLWRHTQSSADRPARRRGPSRAVSVDVLVDAAIALADADGLDAVSMRAVAGRLGIGAMSVYTYVPGKAELLDLMVDTLYTQMPRPPWRLRTWRRRLTRVAEDNRALFTEHPWLADVATLSRPPLGPGLMTKYEHELAAFDRTGLDDVQVDAALAHLLGFVQGHARAARDAARAKSDTAMSDADWWAANQPVLALALDPSTYPRAARVGTAVGEALGTSWSPEHAWSFGLERTLDGLGVLIDGPPR